jgi:hypothetical protein
MPIKPVHLIQDIKEWSEKGFKFVEDEEYKRRIETCKNCEKWNPNSWNGTGSCKICGCSSVARLKMKGMKCPDNPPKW